MQKSLYRSLAEKYFKLEEECKVLKKKGEPQRQNRMMAERSRTVEEEMVLELSP